MHRILYGYRRIDPDQLPTVRDVETGDLRPMTDGELLNIGLQRIDGDLFAFCEQERREVVDGDKVWMSVGTPLPGTIVTAGDVRERHERLPDSARARVMRAHVYRATDRRRSARALADAEVAKRGQPAESPTERRAARLAEARRLAADAESGVVRVTVPMGDVDADEDIVEAEDVIPHMWAGEQ